MDFQDEPVVVSAISDGFRVAVRGPVHVNVAWLEGEFKRIEQARPKLVELDLGGVPHLSSAGMGVFVAARRAITAAGGVVRVVAIQKNVLGSLRFSGLDGVFAIEPSAVVEAGKKAS